MALTAEQNIPNKPEAPKEPWTFRRLFPLAGATKAFTKIFGNPFDILLAYMIVVLSINEFMGNRVSWFFMVFAVLIFLANLLERHGDVILGIKKEGKVEEKSKEVK